MEERYTELFQNVYGAKNEHPLNKIEEKRDFVAVFKVLAADDISCHRKQEQAQNSADRRNEDGDSISAEHLLRRFKDNPIGLGGKFLGQDTVPIKTDRLLRTEGAGNQHDKRQHAQRSQ